MENAENLELVEKDYEQRKRAFNGLTAKEWTSLSKNVWNDVSSARKRNQLRHGATFPEKLAARLIKIYSREGDLVFDPFLGTGTTLEACKNLNRNGIGIELNPEFVEIAKKTLSQQKLFSKIKLEVICDDCRNMETYIAFESIQAIITSPPYANFIYKSIDDRRKTHKKSLITLNNKSVIKPYSADPRDLGNLEYDGFLKELKLILKSCFAVTKKGGYNAWIVKDYRNTQNRIPYIPFHMDLANLGQEIGFKFHDLIIWDQNEQRSLVLLGYPSIFYTNQNCSFIVILRKPNE